MGINKKYQKKKDYYTLTGLTEEQFNDLVSGISFERKRKYSVRQSVGILLTKLRTGVSSSTLKTIFNINTSRGVCKIIRKARKALVAQFVPKCLGFNHISIESVVKDHTTIFARDLLASGNTDTAFLILDGTYIYIEKSSKYTFQRKTYSMYKGRPLVGVSRYRKTVLRYIAIFFTVLRYITIYSFPYIFSKI